MVRRVRHITEAFQQPLVVGSHEFLFPI
ncbi:hypothetical protein [Effusibacillus dendaii]